MAARKQTTVRVHLSPGFLGFDRGWFDVGGYEVEVAGVPMVAHRSITDAAGSESKTSKTYWTITEPRTGLSLVDGSVEKLSSISRALQSAEKKVRLEGGSEAVERTVAKMLADPMYGAPKAEAAV